VLDPTAAEELIQIDQTGETRQVGHNQCEYGNAISITCGQSADNGRPLQLWLHWMSPHYIQTPFDGNGYRSGFATFAVFVRRGWGAPAESVGRDRAN